ncbi:MAG: hypothetical protein P8R37_06135 [Opitutae bacterium]|nr:hypothetical protein [Opitutae bacterium]
MKKRLIQITEPLFERLRLRLLRDKDYQRLQQNQTLLTELVHQARLTNGNATSKDGISFIIFSKDRALQLDGLLRSMLHHVTGAYSIHVLYCASNAAHAHAYQELIGSIQHSDQIQWTKEADFRKDLLHTLQGVQTTSVCFLVDDIVFIRPVDLDTLDRNAMNCGIVSLRLGSQITFCYTKQKAMHLPTLNPSKKQDDLLKFSWEEGSYDWAYPLSVDGHIFPTSEIVVAARLLDYRAPNTFERALQILTSLYQKRPGYCFESPKMFNIPLNRVQNENENLSGEISSEYLLAKWQEGLTLNFITLTNTSTKSVHEERSISFCNRKKN